MATLASGREISLACFAIVIVLGLFRETGGHLQRLPRFLAWLGNHTKLRQCTKALDGIMSVSQECRLNLMSNQLILPIAFQETILQEALAGDPEEICGIVRGRNGKALELYAARNEAENRSINYLVDPQVLMKQFQFEEQGDEMVAIYHSHPASEAYPSATDAWTAQYPDSIFLICSLSEKPPAIRGFLLQDMYLDCNLSRLRREVDFHETRPGLFAYYQPTHRLLPPALVAAQADLSDPFYVVFQSEDDPQQEIEVRYVRVSESRILDA